jgi:hypothetical protein
MHRSGAGMRLRRQGQHQTDKNRQPVRFHKKSSVFFKFP